MWVLDWLGTRVVFYLTREESILSLAGDVRTAVGEYRLPTAHRTPLKLDSSAAKSFALTIGVRMPFVVSFCSVVLMLYAAVPVAAQERLSEGEHPLIVHAASESVAAASRPLLNFSQDGYGLRADLRQPDSMAPALLAAVQERRSPWTYPIIGAVVGAAAGAALGYFAMASTPDYLAPPAYLVTAPLGAVIGALAGVVANAVPPPE